MKINKVLKKLKAEGKIDIPNTTTDDIDKVYPTSTLQTTNGFHAKENSQEGAERQRSMGNRLGVRTNKSVSS